MNTRLFPNRGSSRAARRLVAAAVALAGTMVFTHAFAAILRGLFGSSEAPLAAVELTLAGVLVAGTGATFWPRTGRSVLAVLASGTVLSLAIELIRPGALIPALGLLPAGLTFTLVGELLSRRLPEAIERLARTRRTLAIVWMAVAVLGLVQLGRLSTYIADPATNWFLSTTHPFYAKHECANAYCYAAELNARGEPNVYDGAHYPGLNREAEPQSDMHGLHPEDPFQYAPQFLVWPTLAIELTHDFTVIRQVWFALNVALCIGAVLALAGFIGGSAGLAAGLLSPLLLISFPVLHNFQYGQFHFAAIGLGVLAMIAFARRRPSVGGSLLAVSIFSKLFPAILLVPLVAQRRWKELGWTAGASALLTLVALAMVGPAPFAAFIDYHIPRLADGSAFAFGETWPEVADLVIAGNQGVQGLGAKISAMGLSEFGGLISRWGTRVFALLLLGGAVYVARQSLSGARLHRAMAWVSLLGLASLASAGAWVDYVPLAGVWLTTLLLPSFAARPAHLAVLALTVPFNFFLLGSIPYAQWQDPAWMLPLSLVGALALFVTFTGGLVLARRRSTSSAPADIGMLEPQPQSADAVRLRA